MCTELDNRMRMSSVCCWEERMESRAKPPEWRAVEVRPGHWRIEQNIGGIWSFLGAPPDGGNDTWPTVFTEQDAKLLAGGPHLLTQIVGLNLMMDRLRATMTKATSMRQIRETASDAKLEAFLADVRKTIGEMGGPKDPNIR